MKLISATQQGPLPTTPCTSHRTPTVNGYILLHHYEDGQLPLFLFLSCPFSSFHWIYQTLCCLFLNLLPTTLKGKRGCQAGKSPCSPKLATHWTFQQHSRLSLLHPITLWNRLTDKKQLKGVGSHGRHLWKLLYICVFPELSKKHGF